MFGVRMHCSIIKENFIIFCIHLPIKRLGLCHVAMNSKLGWLFRNVNNWLYWAFFSTVTFYVFVIRHSWQIHRKLWCCRKVVVLKKAQCSRNTRGVFNSSKKRTRFILKQRVYSTRFQGVNCPPGIRPNIWGSQNIKLNIYESAWQ